MPNMYARGILFGKMVLELGDTCTAKNEKHNLSCDLEFKTKVCLQMSFRSPFLASRMPLAPISLVGSIRANSDIILLFS